MNRINTQAFWFGVNATLLLWCLFDFLKDGRTFDLVCAGAAFLALACGWFVMGQERDA